MLQDRPANPLIHARADAARARGRATELLTAITMARSTPEMKPGAAYALEDVVLLA